MLAHPFEAATSLSLCYLFLGGILSLVGSSKSDVLRRISLRRGIVKEV